MAIFVTRGDFSLCFDYCIGLVSECLGHRDGGCCGWSSDNYSDEECIWRCLTANRYRVLQDIEVLCNSDLPGKSEIARETCREFFKKFPDLDHYRNR